MKNFVILCSLLVLFIGQTQAGECDELGNPEDSEFKNFFKTLGCKVKQGADEVVDVAKPYTKQFAESAQSLGATVSKKYDELRHRFGDSQLPLVPTQQPPYDAPTERVLLAPLAPSVPPADAANSQPLNYKPTK